VFYARLRNIEMTMTLVTVMHEIDPKALLPGKIIKAKAKRNIEVFLVLM
jgi:hypothetical protein